MLDAAHNPAGLDALRAYLRSLGRPFSLVFGMLREKVDPSVVAALWGDASSVVVTRPDSPRALTPGELVALVGATPDATEIEPESALERALGRSDLVVVTGSLYLVGELRGWLRERFGAPATTERLFDGAG